MTTTISTFRNDSAGDYDCSIYEYWQRGTVGLDEVTALRFMHKRMTHADCRKGVAHMAATLQSLGVKNGDVVTLCLPNIPVAVCAFYAINYLGAVISVVHPLTPPDALLDTMQRYGSRALLCFDRLFVRQCDVLCKADIDIVAVGAGEYYGPLARGAIRRFNRVPDLRRLLTDVPSRLARVTVYDSRTEVPAAAPHQACGDEVCLLLHSGGTTGVPKTIPVTNHMLNAEAHGIIGLTQTPVVGRSAMLMVLPIFHGFGVAVCMHAMLPFGVCVVLQPAFDPRQSVRLIKRCHVTYLAGVPTMYEKMLSTGRLRGGCARFLQNAYCGGDVLNDQLKEQFDLAMQRAGSTCRLYQGYGLSETVAVCCANSPFAEDRAGTIGRPIQGVQMAIYSEGRRLAVGQRGEICVSGETVMHGYVDDTPEGVLQTHDGRVWLHTGDCGFVDKDGYFHFLGREKRMSVIAGVNVYHQEIEHLAMQVNGVRLAAVTEKNKGGKVSVKLWLVPDLDTNADSVRQQVVALLRRSLTKYCIPREVVIRDSLPLTAMGKVDYRALTAE